MKQIALVDCNSFYASCERVFRPDLKGKPIIVLSNNDGCVIAMSPEAKQMGIKRGDPYFKREEEILKLGVSVFSSNYTLYDDFSKRIMKILTMFSPDIDIYSIDEAFLILSDEQETFEKQAEKIINTVYKWTGIPVSVGVGPTKTLAKIANHIGKKRDKVCCPTKEEWHDILKITPVSEVWGIGKKTSQKLNLYNIVSAADLINKKDLWVKKNLTISGLKTVYELRGIPSIKSQDNIVNKKGIMSSKSFSSVVPDIESLLEAASDYATTAVEKMREQNCSCTVIQTSINTNYFREQDEQYYNSTVTTLSWPTCYTPDVIKVVHSQIEKLYTPGYNYKKVSVFLSGFVDLNKSQIDLFHQEDPRKASIMQAVSDLNKKFGKNTVSNFVESSNKKWTMKRELLSPMYTTRWGDIAKVY